jgi:hypothetical protein
MSATYGLKLIFGIPKKKPTLPKGWHVTFNVDDWARAISPDGQWYFLGVHDLYKIGYATKAMVNAGTLKRVGEEYIDSIHPLPL